MSMKQPWLIVVLTDCCASLRSQLSAQSAGKADRLKPGSRSNPDSSGFGLAIYYVALRRAAAEQAASSSFQSRETAASLEQLLIVLQDRPEPVNGLPGVQVYAKSVRALECIDWCGERMKGFGVLNDWQSAVNWFGHLVAWVSTYPGASLPFDHPWKGQPVPGEIQRYSARDVFEVSGAIARLHETRSAFLDSIASVEHVGGGGMDPFISSLSMGLGEPEESLLRDRSFLSLRALAVVANEINSEPPGPARLAS